MVNSQQKQKNNIILITDLSQSLILSDPPNFLNRSPWGQLSISLIKINICHNDFPCPLSYGNCIGLHSSITLIFMILSSFPMAFAAPRRTNIKNISFLAHNQLWKSIEVFGNPKFSVK